MQPRTRCVRTIEGAAFLLFVSQEVGLARSNRRGDFCVGHFARTSFLSEGAPPTKSWHSEAGSTLEEWRLGPTDLQETPPLVTPAVCEDEGGRVPVLLASNVLSNSHGCLNAPMAHTGKGARGQHIHSLLAESLEDCVANIVSNMSWGVHALRRLWAALRPDKRAPCQLQRLRWSITAHDRWWGLSQHWRRVCCSVDKCGALALRRSLHKVPQTVEVQPSRWNSTAWRSPRR